MLYKLISRILDINWVSQLYLSHYMGKSNMFVCRGRIQLSLSSDTILHQISEVCYIGVSLLGKSTPRNDTTVISCDTKSILELNGCTIGRGVKLSVGPFAYLAIGKNTYITDGSRISAQKSIQIGENCAVSFGVTIIDDDGHGFGSPPYSAPIVIEDDVWICCNVTILKGVTIGKGSVVATGAVVNKSCPPNSLIAGVPAKIIREGVTWTDKSKIGQSI